MIHIREFKRSDFENLILLAECMHDESPNFKNIPMDKSRLAQIGELTIMTPDIWFGRIAERHYVSEGDPEILGFMLGFCGEQYFNREKMAADLSLYVVPSERGSRTAYYLIKEFQNWAVEHEATEITLGISTGVEVDRTKKLYAALGFKEIGPIFKKNYESAD